MKNKYIFILVFLVSSSVFTQDFRIDMTNQKYEEGDWISYGMTRWIRSMAQGIEYVYFASTGGISRYNYYTNRWDFPMTVSNGLSANDILVVAYDVDTNYLWCATPFSVSCYFTTFRRWENYYYDHLGIPTTQEVTSIGFDEDNVWIETDGNLLLRISKQGVYSRIRGTEDNVSMNSIRWFGYRGHNLRQPPEFFMGGNYFFDPNGYITDVQLNRYRVSDWFLDRWGDYWVSTLGLGMGKAEVRIEQLELFNYGLWLNNAYAMKLDAENEVLWIGGIGEYEGESGISSWNIRQDKWSYFQAKYITELPNDQVTSIAIDNPYVWFGTEYGAARYDVNQDEWRHFSILKGLTDNYVYDIAIDETNVWIATAYGLTRFVKASIDSDSLIAFEIKPKGLRQIQIFDVELMENLVWLGTDFGVYVYDVNTDSGGFQAEAGGPVNEPVYAASVFENEVWFGSESGVEVFDVEKKKWLGGPQRRFNTEEPVNYIQAGQEAVWAGTDHGVLKYDRERELWIRFTMEDGLIDNVVNAIVIDGDYVWFGTPSGITKFYWNDPSRID